MRHNFWQNFKAFTRTKLFMSPAVLSGAAFLLIFTAGSFYYLEKQAGKTSIKKSFVVQNSGATTEPSKEEAKAEIKKKPPKHAGSMTEQRSGNAMIVGEGGATQDDINKLNSYAGAGPASTITYNDTTGRYPNLGDTLKSYINSTLLWRSSDIAYMYEIEMVDCSSCNYGGLYTGSYYPYSGDITKAWGFIKLNVYYYKDSPYFEDYMKLILSHEYGHHYSLYHRFVDRDIPIGERWPSDYYSIRPLSLSTTATDYSKGWQNCDVEVVAEDYSYFYSGYGMHQMAGSYGLPSSGTRNWLLGLSGSAPVSDDTTPPSVSISSPTNGAEVSGLTTISASASDNIGITRVEFYVDGSLLSTDTGAPYQALWTTASSGNGSHTITAKAYDERQSAETSISVSVNNTSSDSEKPTVTISQPASCPYAWSSGNLPVTASGNDNVGVVKVEFYINGSKVAEQSGSSISRTWMHSGTPSGSYQLKAQAYDAAGNWGETTCQIDKTF